MAERAETHWRLASVATIAAASLALSLSVGGWVWFFSGQARALEEQEHRITKLEARDLKLTEVSERLARMEPMLEMLVKRVVP